MPKPSKPLTMPPQADMTPQDLIALAHLGLDLSGEALASMSTYFAAKKAERLLADKVAARLKEEEDAAKACIIDQLRKQKMNAVGGDRVTVALTEDDVPKVDDWTLFYAHILATQSFEFLERRPGKGAIKERWAADEEVPGVSKFRVYNLSVSKVK